MGISYSHNKVLTSVLSSICGLDLLLSSICALDLMLGISYSHTKVWASGLISICDLDLLLCGLLRSICALGFWSSICDLTLMLVIIYSLNLRVWASDFLSFHLILVGVPWLVLGTIFPILLYPMSVWMWLGMGCSGVV